MKTSVKLTLWKMGLLPNDCPYCGRPLQSHGFPISNERWTCPDKECRFNKEIKCR